MFANSPCGFQGSPTCGFNALELGSFFALPPIHVWTSWAEVRLPVFPFFFWPFNFGIGLSLFPLTEVSFFFPLDQFPPDREDTNRHAFPDPIVTLKVSSISWALEYGVPMQPRSTP